MERVGRDRREADADGNRNEGSFEDQIKKDRKTPGIAPPRDAEKSERKAERDAGRGAGVDGEKPGADAQPDAPQDGDVAAAVEPDGADAPGDVPDGERTPAAPKSDAARVDAAPRKAEARVVEAGAAAGEDFAGAAETDKGRAAIAEAIDGKQIADRSIAEQADIELVTLQLQRERTLAEDIAAAGAKAFKAPEFMAANITLPAYAPVKGKPVAFGTGQGISTLERRLATAGTNILPADINGAFVANEKTGGAVLVRAGLDAATLQGTAREEYGEAIGAYADGLGIKVAQGDVGARLAAVLAGKPVSRAATPELFEARATDTTTVMLNGQAVEAKAQAAAPIVLNIDPGPAAAPGTPLAAAATPAATADPAALPPDVVPPLEPGDVTQRRTVGQVTLESDDRTGITGLEVKGEDGQWRTISQRNPRREGNDAYANWSWSDPAPTFTYNSDGVMPEMRFRKFRGGHINIAPGADGLTKLTPTDDGFTAEVNMKDEAFFSWEKGHTTKMTFRAVEQPAGAAPTTPANPQTVESVDVKIKVNNKWASQTRVEYLNQETGEWTRIIEKKKGYRQVEEPIVLGEGVTGDGTFETEHTFSLPVIAGKPPPQIRMTADLPRPQTSEYDGTFAHTSHGTLKQDADGNVAYHWTHSDNPVTVEAGDPTQTVSGAPEITETGTGNTRRIQWSSGQYYSVGSGKNRDRQRLPVIDMTINVKTKPYEAPATETLASGRLPIPPKPSETDPLFTPEEAKAQIELERQLDAGEITKTEYDDKIFEQSFGPRPTDPAAATQYDKQKAKIETGLDLVRNPMEALGLHKGDFADAGLRVHDSHLASLQENQAEIDAAIETGEASLPGAGKADGVEAQGATVVGNNGTGRFLKTVFRVGADVGENGKNLSERIIVTTPLEKINGVWRAVKGSQDTTSYEVKVRTVVDVPIPNSNGAAGQEIGLDGRFKFSVKRNGEGGKPQQRLDKFSVVGLHEVVLDAGAGLQAAREGAAAYIARRTRRDPPPDIEMGDPPDDPGGPDDPGDPPDVPPLVAMPIQPPTYNDFVNTVRGMNPGARQFLETLPPNRLTPEMIQARALAIERIDRLEELVDQYGDGQGDNIPERREFEEAAEQANYRLEVVGQHLQHGPGALPSGTGALTGIAVPPPPAMGAGPSSGVGPSGSGLAVRQAQIPPIPDFAIVETGVYAPFLSLDFWNADAKGTLPDGSPKPFVPGAAGWDWVPDSLQITAGAFVDLGPRVRAPGEGADTRWQIFNDFVQNKQAVVRLPFNVEAWIEAGWKVDFTDIGRQPAA